MELRAYTDADYAFTVRLETDPEVMAHLGGPVDPARLPRVHRLRAAGGCGECWLCRDSSRLTRQTAPDLSGSADPRASEHQRRAASGYRM